MAPAPAALALRSTDRGLKYGCGKPNCGVGCDCDRFMEIWNLVFSQYDADGKGNYELLAKPNIDTGMGLERLAVVMQDVNNLFEVDTVAAVLHHVERISGKKYGENEKDDISIRVITDHIRATVFMASGRHPAVQRGPRLRHAPSAAPRRPPWPYAGHQPPVPDRAGRNGHRVQRGRLPPSCASMSLISRRSSAPRSCASAAPSTPV